MKVLFTFLHLSSPILIENDHNFVFFDYKVSTQQHFESRLFWKNAEKLRIHAQLTQSDLGTKTYPCEVEVRLVPTDILSLLLDRDLVGEVVDVAVVDFLRSFVGQVSTFRRISEWKLNQNKISYYLLLSYRWISDRN